MKLRILNETSYEDDVELDDALDKYVKARGAGNVNKLQSTDDPDDAGQPDRSGNQSAAATDDDDAEDLLGVSGNSRDKQSPPNLAPNPSPSI